MRFASSDLQTILDTARAHVPATAEERAVRAVHDNFAFEENVGSDRQAEFERLPVPSSDLRARMQKYFERSVQGGRRGHLPSTFSPINAPALMAAAIEDNQTIVRLECVEDYFTANPPETDADTLETSLKPALTAPLVRHLDSFAGERPAFGCFKAEVKRELKDKGNWLIRLIQRLGLGHWAPPAGTRLRFALMEYSVGEVKRQAAGLTGLAQPFAKPTVLDARNSPFFFPSPADSKEGFAADLDPTPGQNSIREFLHIRIKYAPEHVTRIGTLHGPISHNDLKAIRNAHLTAVRERCHRADFGAEMP